MDCFDTTQMEHPHHDRYYENMRHINRAIEAALPTYLYAETSPSKKMPEIKEIIFNNPYTIVRWSDDTETKVRCVDKDTFSKETGLAMAITKKYFQRISPSHRSELKKCIRFAKDYSKKK